MHFSSDPVPAFNFYLVFVAGLLEVLNELTGKLESMQRGLEQYLETKRHAFPRFYFISNDDLLEILANAKKPELIQQHIRKLFENIKCLTLSKVDLIYIGYSTLSDYPFFFRSEYFNFK